MKRDGLGPLAWVFLILIALFMLVPLLVVAAASLSAGAFLVFPPQGISLRWYAALIDNPRYAEAARTSLWLAAVVTVLAVAIGTPAAIGLARRRLPGGGLVDLLLMSPLLLPAIVLALGLLIQSSDWLGGPSLAALLLGHVVIALPYVVRTVSASLAGLARDTDDAARAMGAGWWARTWLVLLPQCRAGILAGALLAFIISFDDAVLVLFLRSPTLETLPLRIYGDLEFAPDPTVAAASTGLILIAAAVVFAMDRLLGVERAAGTHG